MEIHVENISTTSQLPSASTDTLKSTFPTPSFEELGLFDEQLEADMVDLFFDAFCDAANNLGDVQLEPFDDFDAALSPTLLDAFSAAVGDDIPDYDEQALRSPPVQDEHFIQKPHYVSPPGNVCLNKPYSLISQIPVVPTFNCPRNTPAEPKPASTLLEETKFERRQKAIARWREKKKRRAFAQQRFPEYECRRHVANRRPRVNGRFVREQPIYVSISQLEMQTQRVSS